MSTLGSYDVIAENPGGSHARESLIPNVWLVTCKQCGTYDIVGPGHPAMADRGDGTHALADRSKVRHVHADGCEPGEDGNRPFDFSFMVAPPAMQGRQS